jgi:hypothetical protein
LRLETGEEKGAELVELALKLIHFTRQIHLFLFEDMDTVTQFGRFLTKLLVRRFETDNIGLPPVTRGLGGLSVLHNTLELLWCQFRGINHTASDADVAIPIFKGRILRF